MMPRSACMLFYIPQNEVSRSCDVNARKDVSHGIALVEKSDKDVFCVERIEDGK